MRAGAFVSLAVLVMALAVLSGPSVAGTLSGVITDSATGNVISGGLVRTDGEPTYQTVSDSSGNYTITLSATTCNVLVSAAGYVPQRTTIVSTGSASRIFALRAAPTSGSSVSLPAPLDWGEPPSAPTPPGDSYPVQFPDMAAVPASNSPKICGWSEIVKPDESFTLTGVNFTARTGADAGSDTTVWIYARTSDSVGVLRQARLWHVTDTTLTATVPDDVPYGMYLVWVENQNGVGLPICVNKTTAAWVGPLGNTVQAGNKKRVFGRNISQNRDSATSYVYIQPAAGGSLISCPVSTVNPYMVEFTVPLGTPNGNYKVYVHNGHGGVYGWSDGLPLTVADDFVRGTGIYNMPAPTGTDDTVNLRTALSTANGWANGGTIQFQTGTYKINAEITLKANVRLLGKGMNSTKIECRLTNPSSHGAHFYLAENNVCFDGLEVKACVPSPANSYAVGFFSSPTSDIPDSFRLSSCRITYEPAVSVWAGGTSGCRTEVSNCEIYFGWNAGSYDGWIHGGTLYGGSYEGCEAPFSPTVRTVFENCAIKTNWPYDGTKPNPYNYEEWMPYDTLRYLPWAKRISLYAYSGLFSRDTYSANLTGTNIAVEGSLNRGEQFLAHPFRGAWFGQVASNSGLTITVNTDLLTDVIFSGDANGNPLYGGGYIPNYRPPDYWLPVDADYVMIINGRGMGQLNKVVSHTTTTLTVDKPWRIQPDSTSLIVVSPMYVGHVVYNNNVSAFPSGYVQNYSGSTGFQLANTYQFFLENNKTYRTYSGGGMVAHSGGPTMWCSIRNQEAHDCYNSGYGTGADPNYTNSAAPVFIGDSFYNCSVNVYGSVYYGSTPYGAMCLSGEGTIAENFRSPNPGDTGKGVMLGYQLYGAAVSADCQNGFTLYRNGNITAMFDQVDPPVLQPVLVGRSDERQFLINNNYTGAPQNYYMAAGLTSYSIPAPELRVARFSGYAGSPVPAQIIPIANAGIAAMTWTATPGDSWITTSIQSNGTLSPESTMGRLVIGVDTTGMTAGRHWGSVTISNGTKSVKMGVCVDLSSGTPSDRQPIASFTANPTAGAAALNVGFDARASYDPDGSIVSYAWDFGDGTYGAGAVTNHTYTGANTFTPVLTVTDGSGGTASSWTNVTVSQSLSGVTLSGSPLGAIAANTPVTLTANATGGYLVQHKFLVKTGSGWTTLRDYQSGNTFVWTPSSSGYYDIKVYTRNTGSTNVYDAVSNVLSYPVGLLPSGPKLWLKADTGVSVSGTAVTSWADQSGSGNSVTQPIGSLQPSYVSSGMNGKPVVRFTGPGQMMQSANQVLSGSTSFTSFVVVDYNQLPSAYQYIWWNGSNATANGYGCYLTSSRTTKCGWANYDAAPTYPTTATVGTCYSITTRFTSTSGNGPNELWVNGNSTVSRPKTGSNLSGGTFTLGNYGPSPGNGLYGDVAEVMIYDRALTDTERLGVESYLAGRWVAPTPRLIARLKDVKALGDGVLVSLTSPMVATSDAGVYADGSIYISEPDRTCGMKVLGAGTVASGDNLTLTGTTDTDQSTGERVLRVTSVATGANTPLGALGMTNNSFSAAGQLVTVWGKVTSVSSTCFTIDDGSKTPVNVEIDGLVAPLAVAPTVGQYVSATGPTGLAAGGVAAVRVRSDADIRGY